MNDKNISIVNEDINFVTMSINNSEVLEKNIYIIQYHYPY